MRIRTKAFRYCTRAEPDPHILAQEIADDLRSALGQIEDVLSDLDPRADVVAQGDDA